jgi:hypothetical protein
MEKSEIPWGLHVGRKNNFDLLKFNPLRDFTAYSLTAYSLFFIY